MAHAVLRRCMCTRHDKHEWREACSLLLADFTVPWPGAADKLGNSELSQTTAGAGVGGGSAAGAAAGSAAVLQQVGGVDQGLSSLVTVGSVIQ